MQLEYSDHIRRRLELRHIKYELPRIVFEQAEERYFDTETGHFIAVMKVDLYNKSREVLVAYAKEEELVTLLTIHPLKEGQKEARVKAHRWRKV